MREIVHIQAGQSGNQIGAKPITLQALPGLPPGASHLLVKTENGQFQLVSVRLPAPTAATPGTPVVPTTGAPSTSMSIAQQLPSNSPLAPPPVPPSPSAPSGPTPPVMPTTAVLPHSSQQGRIITSWPSAPINNNVVNSTTMSSPLPVLSSSTTVPMPQPIRLVPPPLPTVSHPPPTPSSVIMPPSLSAGNSQLLTGPGGPPPGSSSITFSTRAAAAEFMQNHMQHLQQHRAAHPVVVSNSSGGVPPPSMGMVPPISSPNTSVSPAPVNVLRVGGMPANNFPPPPPPVIVNTTSGSTSTVTSSTHGAVSNISPLPPATSSISFRPQTTIPVPSNNAASSSTANMSNETAKTKCKNFLSFLLELSAKQNQTVARNVKNLIQGLIDGKVNEENFADRLQKEVNSQPQPCLVGFLKKSLPHLRHSLATGELKIDGIKPPPLSTFVPPAPVSTLVPQTTSTSTERKPSKASSSKSKVNSSGNNSGGAASSVLVPGSIASPAPKSTIPSTVKLSKEKEKKDKAFSSSGYSADDDINDVAAMGGVNLAEESQRILGSTEFVGTQIRSCRDESLIQASPIIAKFKVIAARYGLEDTQTAEFSSLLSHAVEEKLKTMVEKLSVIAEHRMDVIKMDERYQVTQDVKGQLRFLEELGKLEKKRHDEQEREILIRAAKSRSKSEDPEQAKLKAKAKEMQRVQLEEMRQRDANLTALEAIGPRKKAKLDTLGGSPGVTVPSSLGTAGATGSLGRPQAKVKACEPARSTISPGTRQGNNKEPVFV